MSDDHKTPQAAPDDRINRLRAIADDDEADAPLFLRATIREAADALARLRAERDEAQRSGVTHANYWKDRAERAEAAFDTMRQSREAAVRLWNDCGEDLQHLVSRLTSITAAADGMRRGEDCPMCDSGKLHDPNKEHWDTCAFAAYDAARSKK